MNYKRYLVFLSVSSFVLTVIWIASNVYHSYATSTIEPLLQTQIQPIPSRFDEETLTDLRNREVIEPSEEALIFSQLTDEEEEDDLSPLDQQENDDALSTEELDEQESLTEPIFPSPSPLDQTGIPDNSVPVEQGGVAG